MPRIAATTDQLSDSVATNADATITDETVIHDAGQLGCKSFERLKIEFQRAFAVPDNGYTPLTAAEVITRNER